MKRKQLYRVLCCLWACLFVMTGFARTVNGSIPGQGTPPSGVDIAAIANQSDSALSPETYRISTFNVTPQNGRP